MTGHTVRLAAQVAAAVLLGACGAAPPHAAASPWIELFDGRSLGGWVVTDFGGQGAVRVTDGAMRLDFGSPLTGVTWTGPPPRGDYELEVVAAREAGTDFFCGLTFPVGDAHLTLVLGGWGGSVSGLSSIDGRDAARNDTRRVRGFVDDRDYAIAIAVTGARVAVRIDGEAWYDLDLTGHELGLRAEVLLSRPLGIASFATRARVRAVRWRPAAAPPR